jgi:hypothetical protein
MGSQRGVPQGRYAWLTEARLTVALLGRRHQELAHRGKRGDVVGMVAAIAEPVEGHHRVGHGRENGAEPVFAVEARRDEGHRPVDGPLPVGQPREYVALDRLQHLVEAEEELAP